MRRSILCVATATLVVQVSAVQAGTIEVPEDKQILRIDHLPGKLGAVFFAHAEHVAKGDGSTTQPVECAKCHHDRKWKPMRSAADVQPCPACHVELNARPEVVDGKVAAALAMLKPNGAIDHGSVLYHPYCRDSCHKGASVKSRRLGTCRACHERGISAKSIGLRYDEVSDTQGTMSWLRCVQGQRWTTEGCKGKATPMTWWQAEAACPEGFVLPARRHLVELLDGCDEKVTRAEDGGCRPCLDSERCSALFPSIADKLWTASSGDGDSPRAWTTHFGNGRLRQADKKRRAAVLCVRDSFPEKERKTKATARRIGRCDIFNSTGKTFTLKSGTVSGQRIGPHLRTPIASGIIVGKSADGGTIGGSCADGSKVKIVEQDSVFIILPQ